jgi:hypothetical protein
LAEGQWFNSLLAKRQFRLLALAFKYLNLKVYMDWHGCC